VFKNRKGIKRLKRANLPKEDWELTIAIGESD
jgi:hypothetical protein